MDGRARRGEEGGTETPRMTQRVQSGRGSQADREVSRERLLEPSRREIQAALKALGRCGRFQSDGYSWGVREQTEKQHGQGGWGEGWRSSVKGLVSLF